MISELMIVNFQSYNSIEFSFLRESGRFRLNECFIFCSSSEMFDGVNVVQVRRPASAVQTTKTSQICVPAAQKQS